MTLGTRIAVLNQGKLVQFDIPRRVYHEPATRFVAEFIGRPAMNIIEGEISSGLFKADTLELPVTDQPDGPVAMGIRPEQVVLRDGPTDKTVSFELDVLELIEPDTLLFVKKGAAAMVVRIMRDVGDLVRGTEVHLELPDHFRHFFEIRDGSRRL